MSEPLRVVFAAALRGESAQCVSHVTLDGKRTLCGLEVERAPSVEPWDGEPADCLRCNRRQSTGEHRGKP